MYSIKGRIVSVPKKYVLCYHSDVPLGFIMNRYLFFYVIGIIPYKMYLKG